MVPTGGKIFPIDYRVEEINGKLTFTTNDIGLVFLGVLGKSIIDLISANLEQNISSRLNDEIEKHAKEAVRGYLSRADYTIKLQDFRRCLQCGLDNDYKNKFCSECGTKLPE
jgi:hypothetical protein